MVNPPVDRAEAEERLVAARAELERRVRAGQLTSAKDLRDEFPEVWDDPEAALELVYAEYVVRLADGESPSREEWHKRYPAWRDRLERLFRLYDLMADAGTHDEHADGTINADPVSNIPEPDAQTEYELLNELGRGGMAVVHLARQCGLNRLVALKMLRGGDWFRVEDADRIRREAQAAARLQHPNIVQIHEVGDWDGMPFLSMEYVPGGTLADVLARSRLPGGIAITPVQAAELIQTLARAMQYAHDRGIVHRDLKPANILMSGNAERPFSEPKIADFGLALNHDLSSSVTQTAALAGTPSFMAPEQADSRCSAIGPRTDVYALGGVLYELLTGRPPFLGATVLETLDLVRGTEPVAPRLLRPHIPRDLETICLKCLQKDHARRYGSATALADDLQRFQDNRPISARPVGSLEKAWKWCRRRPMLAATLGALAIAVTSTIVLLSITLQRTEKARITEAVLRDEAESREAKLLIKTARLQWLGHDLPGARETLASCAEAHRDAEWANLWRACRAPIHELQWTVPVNGRFARAMSYSPDAQSLAVYFTGNELRAWNTATGRESHAVSAVPIMTGVTLLHPSAEDVAYAYASTVLGPPRKGIKIVESIDIKTGIRRKVWELDKTHSQLLITPDARYAIYSLTGATFSTIDLSSGTQLHDTKIGDGKPTNMVLSPDGKFAVCHTLGLPTPVYDVRTGVLTSTFPEMRQTYLVAVNHGASRIALRTSRIGQPNSIVIRDAIPDRPEITIPTPFIEIANVHFSPDGHWIAASGREGSLVCVWDALTGREVIQLRGHRDRVGCMSFSPDSRNLAIGCAGGRVAIWDIIASD